LVELLFNKIDVRRCVIGPHAALAFGSGVVDPPAVARTKVVAVAGRDSLDSLGRLSVAVLSTRSLVPPTRMSLPPEGDGVAAAEPRLS